MGLPQLDFRVPEGTWFKSVLAGRFGTMPGLSATGALGLAVQDRSGGRHGNRGLRHAGHLRLGRGGNAVVGPVLRRFLAAMKQARPSRVRSFRRATALLNADDLMSSLNLTDYSPGDDHSRAVRGRGQRRQTTTDNDGDEDSVVGHQEEVGDEPDDVADHRPRPTPKPTTSSADHPGPTPKAQDKHESSPSRSKDASTTSAGRTASSSEWEHEPSANLRRRAATFESSRPRSERPTRSVRAGRAV